MTTAGQLTFDFDGKTFERERDGLRLGKQLESVRMLMLDGVWRSLQEIAAVVEGSESGISARLRDLRKARFGGYRVDRRRRDGCSGTWEYRVRRY